MIKLFDLVGGLIIMSLLAGQISKCQATAPMPAISNKVVTDDVINASGVLVSIFIVLPSAHSVISTFDAART